MTTATAGAPRSWSRQRQLAAALVVSAALNIFFIGGAVWIRLQPPPQAPATALRYQEIGAQLNLDASQRAGFDRLLAALRARSEKTHQQLEPLVNAAWDAVAKPGANPGEVQQLLDAASDKRREFQHETIAQMLDFLATLSP